MEAKPSIINKFAIKEIPVTTHAKVEILLNGTSNIHHSKKIGAKVIPNGKPDKNPRNMVAGRLGGKTVRKGLNDIDFVAYESRVIHFDRPDATVALFLPVVALFLALFPP